MLAYATHSNVILAERLKGAIGRWADVAIYERGREITMIVDACNGTRSGDPSHYAQALRLDLALGAPASCSVDGSSRKGSIYSYAGWDLVSGNSYDDGPFKDAFWWLSYELWNPDLVDHHPSEFLPALDGWRPQHDHNTHRRMEEICAFAAERAVRLCDPAAREVAMRVGTDARFFVYGALLADPSGRVRQMFDVCPGLLILGAACDPRGPRARDVIEGIRAGRKLADLIDLVLPAAIDAYCTTRTTCQLARSADALVRRAPLLSLDELLHLLHAPGLDLNDLPTVKVDVETWCDTMIEWSCHAGRITNRDRSVQLGGFFSKHALALEGSRYAIEEILDWVERSGSPVPTRRSSPARVRRAVDEWHATLHLDLGYDMDTKLAQGPIAPHPVDGIDAVAIQTVGQLVSEGLEMRHCVASGASLAVAGVMFFYRAEIDGARVTIAIVRSHGHWRLQEAAGFANRRLDDREMTTIERWMEALR